MNLSLIGMSGVGKSTVGKILAEKLGYQFIDIDRRLEDQFGGHISQILETLGEERFLKIESDEVHVLPEKDRMVIAPGGSIIYSEKAVQHLKQISKVIYLNASSEWIMTHATPEIRGIVGLKNRTFAEVYGERSFLYANAADLKVNVENRNPENIVEEIIKIVNSL